MNTIHFVATDPTLLKLTEEKLHRGGLLAKVKMKQVRPIPPESCATYKCN